jgi:ABC-type dipeptide/oligopeptide/nickel transport system ATPase subunit
LYREKEVTQKFEHSEFLEQVIQQESSPKSNGKRLGIIGEPGAGKTMLLRQIANWVAAEIGDCNLGILGGFAGEGIRTVFI